MQVAARGRAQMAGIGFKGGRDTMQVAGSGQASGRGRVRVRVQVAGSGYLLQGQDESASGRAGPKWQGQGVSGS
jgi:hypothetical protein